MTARKIYLDTNTYNRPFDDQSQPRIKMETLAVTAILQLTKNGQLDLVISSILEFENSRNPFELRRKWVEDCLGHASVYLKLDESMRQRALQLETEGLKALDALHVSCAEAAGCDDFLTCDDKLIKRYHGNTLRVQNPMEFILTYTDQTS